MPELKVDAVVNLAGTGKPNFPVSPTHSGGSALTTLNTYSYTSSGTEPSSPKNGAIWWDSSNNKVMVYIAGEFKEISLNNDYPSSFSWGGDRGLFGGGYASGFRNEIDYVDITSAGNATDFGDLTSGRNGVAVTASTTRSVFAIGYDGSAYSNVLDYVTTASPGNATDFGDYSPSGLSGTSKGVVSDSTTGLFGGGYYNSARDNSISKITIATPGNATDFGDLTEARNTLAGAGDGSRGLFIGGRNASFTYVDTVDYVTIANAGNATDFGNLTVGRSENSAASDATRALCIGGVTAGAASERVTIDYVTIQSAGNATDFGDLTGQMFDGGACSNGTKAVNVGYYNSATANNIEQMTIQTAANATDFGDTTVARNGAGATSGTAS
jgi:hypothetical protein